MSLTCVYVCICVCLYVYCTLSRRLDSTLEYPAAPLTPPGATALNAYHHPWVPEKYFRIIFFSELQNAKLKDHCHCIGLDWRGVFLCLLSIAYVMSKERILATPT